MREKLLSALAASAIVMFTAAGTAAAPVATHTDVPPGVERFLARLPSAQLARSPKKVVTSAGRESLGVKTTASRVIVLDETSGTELYASRADEQNPIASVTKLMTARVLRSYGLDWKQVVTVQSVSDGGGVAYFFPGDQVTVRDLWRAMLVGSSNSAASELVRLSGIGSEAFINEMNASAAGLGMAHTHFSDPTGLDAGNVSTARDLSLLARAAFADPEIAEATTTRSFVFQRGNGTKRTVKTTDKLLDSFINKSPYQIIGGKTGFITESGYNMVLKVERKNAGALIVVVLGSSTDTTRFQDAKSLAYWAFENFRWSSPAVAGAMVP